MTEYPVSTAAPVSGVSVRMQVLYRLYPIFLLKIIGYRRLKSSIIIGYNRFMYDAIRHLDARFAALKVLGDAKRPPKGWIRAIRDALGMTSAQFARRMGVVQSSATELEQAEARDSITLKRLERAAEALGCRVVYALVPKNPLSEIVRARAERIADQQLAAVEHTMGLENQAVPDSQARAALHQRAVEDLLRNPSRLWDER